MPQWIYRTEQFRISGVDILHCRIALPIPDDIPALAEFYQQIAESSYQFCKTTLRSEAENAYQICSDPLKRFYFPTFLYRIDGKICYCQDDWISICIETEWKRRNNSLLSYTCDAHTWKQEEKELFLVPPYQAADLFLSQKLSRMQKRKAKGILITTEQVLLCFGDRWEFLADLPQTLLADQHTNKE